MAYVKLSMMFDVIAKQFAEVTMGQILFPFSVYGFFVDLRFEGGLCTSFDITSLLLRTQGPKVSLNIRTSYKVVNQ